MSNLKTLCIALFLLSFITSISAQSSILKGLVVDEYSGSPIKGLSVFIGGVHQKTTSTGRFEIDVSQIYQPGKEIEIGLFHEDYNFNTVRINLPQDLTNSVTLRVKRDDRIAFIGVVIDKNSRAPIEGVDVTLSSRFLVVDAPIEKTDEFGVFTILISKNAFSQQIQNGRLMFHDPKERYQDLQKSFDLGDLITVELELGYTPPIRINSFFEYRVNARRGSIVSVSASGNIKVGEYVGTAGPNGKEGGVFGLSLASYSIDPNIHHAALMYKLDINSPWKACGGNCSFVLPKDGEQSIYFQINDKHQYDNSGAFDVKVLIQN